METWTFFTYDDFYFLPGYHITLYHVSGSQSHLRFSQVDFRSALSKFPYGHWKCCWYIFSKRGTFGTVCAVSAACEISVKVCFLWLPTRYIKNRIYFLKDLHQTTCGLRLEWLGLSVLFQMLFPVMQFESEIDSGLKMIPKIDLNEFKPIF